MQKDVSSLCRPDFPQSFENDPAGVVLVGTLAFIRYYRLLYKRRQLHPTLQSDGLTCPMPMFPAHTELRKRKDI
jgi:hypothetical protein